MNWMSFLLSKRFLAVLLRVLLGLVVAYTLASVFASVMHVGVGWAFKGVNNGLFFGDLRGLTSALQCPGDLSDVYLLDNCVSEGLPRFNYTLLSLQGLKFINFKYAYTEYFGAFLGISSILATGIFFARALGGNSMWAACAALALASFPLQLAIERGNTDQLIYVGLALYAWVTATAPNSLISKASLSVISFSLVALKIFPVLVILPHAFLLRSRQILYFAVAPSLVALFIQLPILGSISANTPKGSGLYSYGLLTHYAFAIKRIVPAYIDFRVGVAILLFLKLTLIALTLRYWLILACQLRPCLANLLLQAPDHQVKYNFFIVGALTYVTTYFVFVNWDYRLVSLVFCVPLLIALCSEKCKAPWIRLFAIACLACMFMLSYEGYFGLFFPGRPAFVVAASIISDLLLQPFLVGSLLSLMAMSGITKTMHRDLIPGF